MLQTSLFRKFKVAHVISILLFTLSCLLCVASTVFAEPTTLKVGVLKNFPPQYQLDNKGRPIGLAIDIIETLASQTNSQLQYLVYDSWNELTDALTDGRIDLIPNSGIIIP